MSTTNKVDWQTYRLREDQTPAYSATNVELLQAVNSLERVAARLTRSLNLANNQIGLLADRLQQNEDYCTLCPDFQRGEDEACLHEGTCGLSWTTWSRTEALSSLKRERGRT